ncbi:hypothetical protein DFJ73DRAFT_394652 [Zopfochytrium polystomum]|nr:hypothetical protein DFJ73DRAFT_394652 [Zopfochytrium polystomum]
MKYPSNTTACEQTCCNNHHHHNNDVLPTLNPERSSSFNFCNDSAFLYPTTTLDTHKAMHSAPLTPSPIPWVPQHSHHSLHHHQQDFQLHRMQPLGYHSAQVDQESLMKFLSFDMPDASLAASLQTPPPATGVLADSPTMFGIPGVSGYPSGEASATAYSTIASLLAMVAAMERVGCSCGAQPASSLMHTPSYGRAASPSLGGHDSIPQVHTVASALSEALFATQLRDAAAGCLAPIPVGAGARCSPAGCGGGSKDDGTSCEEDDDDDDDALAAFDLALLAMTDTEDDASSALAYTPETMPIAIPSPLPAPTTPPSCGVAQPVSVSPTIAATAPSPTLCTSAPAISVTAPPTSNTSAPSSSKSAKSSSTQSRRAQHPRGRPSPFDRRPRVFPCLVEGCDNTFMRRQDLKRHLKTHTGARPYTCALGCGTTFSRTDAATRHVKARRCQRNDPSLPKSE